MITYLSFNSCHMAWDLYNIISEGFLMLHHQYNMRQSSSLPRLHHYCNSSTESPVDRITGKNLKVEQHESILVFFTPKAERFPLLHSQSSNRH